MANPLIYLIENLNTHPTFPMVLGVLQARSLLPETDDPYDDGLLLLSHLQDEVELDELDQSVTLEICEGLGVPVFHLRDRAYALRFRSVFRAVNGPAKGRFCVRDNVEPNRFTELSACYRDFYNHLKFGHAVALEERRLSRDRVTREWVRHEDTQDFADALEVLDDCTEEIEPISE